jgi:hypothetical protein
MPAREGGLRVSKLIEEGRGDLPDVMTARSTRGDLFVEDISNTHGFACWRRVLKTDAASWSLRSSSEWRNRRAVLEVFFLYLKLRCGTIFAPKIVPQPLGALTRDKGGLPVSLTKVNMNEPNKPRPSTGQTNTF